MTVEYFGERLKAVRKSKNLTQLALANILEVNKGTISSYEQGLSYPTMDTLVKICTILNTSSDYLLGLSDNLPYKLGGLTDEQVEMILQLATMIEKGNKAE